jgi:hypothetical protein
LESEAALDVVERGLDKRALAEAIPLAERTLILVEAAELTSPSLGRCRILVVVVVLIAMLSSG